MQEKDSESNGHIIHMWQPLGFQVEEGYDYRMDGFFLRVFSIFLRVFAVCVFTVYNYLFLGFRIKGKENLKGLRRCGAISICTHNHMLDCTMVNLAYTTSRLYYLTLESNFRIPLIRHLIKFFGAVPISSDAHCLRELFDEMQSLIHRGSIVHVYPEAVLHPYYCGVRKFQKGAFYLSVKSGAPIIPSVITFHRPRGIRRLFRRKPCLYLEILPAVYPDPGNSAQEEIKRLQKLCHDTMSEYYQSHSEFNGGVYTAKKNKKNRRSTESSSEASCK